MSIITDLENKCASLQQQMLDLKGERDQLKSDNIILRQQVEGRDEAIGWIKEHAIAMDIISNHSPDDGFAMDMSVKSLVKRIAKQSQAFLERIGEKS